MDQPLPLWTTLSIAVGYWTLILATLLAIHTRHSLHQAEDTLHRIIRQQAEARQKNRLLKELQGEPNGFPADPAIQPYSKPAHPV